MIPVISPAVIATVILISLPVLYWGFNFIVLYHLLRFGVGIQPKKIAAAYFIGSSFLFCLSVLLLFNVDTLGFRDEIKELFNYAIAT